MFSATKDPQSTLDYNIDWSQWLGTDTITTSTWAADTGVTLTNPSRSGAVTTVWVAGGTVKNQYTVTNHIVTTAGRTDERSITVIVEQQ